MNLHNIQLNWLRTFEAAARLNSFSKAAEEINLTQSAVSQQIKLLEHHLKHPLFHRQHRRLSLTYEGVQFLPVVQNALHGIERSANDIFTGNAQNELCIEVNIGFAWLWLNQRLGNFCVNYPDINLQIVHTNWQREFNPSGIDLAIRHGEGKWPGWDTEAILKPELKPFCTSIMGGLINQPIDVISKPLIEIMGNRQGWKHWLRQSGIETQSLRTHKVDSIATAMHLASSGVGVFLGYEQLVACSNFRNSLVSPLKEFISTEDSIHLCHPTEQPLSSQAKYFKDWIKNELSLSFPHS